MDIRLAMAKLGWRSEDKLTDQGWGGKFGYSIWFERYDWHGKRTLVQVGSAACYHAHSSNLDDVAATVQRAADLAIKAWNDFPECPPSQGLGNELVARSPLR